VTPFSLGVYYPTQPVSLKPSMCVVGVGNSLITFCPYSDFDSVSFDFHLVLSNILRALSPKIPISLYSLCLLTIKEILPKPKPKCTPTTPNSRPLTIPNQNTLPKLNYSQYSTYPNPNIYPNIHPQTQKPNPNPNTHYPSKLPGSTAPTQIVHLLSPKLSTESFPHHVPC